MDRGLEERLTICRTNVARIYSMLQTQPEECRAYVDSARSVMAEVDTIPFMAEPDKSEEQIWVIEGLQKLAFLEPESGGFSDIAEWCLRQWLNVLQNNPHSVGVLKGLGQAWLLRAQSFLGRIHQDSSPSSGSSQPRPGSMIYTVSDDDRDAAVAVREADARLHTSDYVEARGMLLPAVEYFDRAVRAAEMQGLSSGDLLALAGEAYISLGNVSYSSTNERLFHRALLYLREATEHPGYTLGSDLQQFLDEYGKLLD